jgi:hypothetical protein
MHETVAKGTLHGDLLYSASLTGGRTADALHEALREIQEDSQGYYVLRIELTPRNTNWRMIARPSPRSVLQPINCALCRCLFNIGV